MLSHLTRRLIDLTPVVLGRGRMSFTLFSHEESAMRAVTLLAVVLAAAVTLGAGAGQAALFEPKTHRDLTMSSATPFSHHEDSGGNLDLAVGHHVTAGVHRTLVGFDLSALAGQYSQITGVTLQLSVAATSGGVGDDNKIVQVYEVKPENDDWTDANGSSSSWDWRINDITVWDGGKGLGEIDQPVDADDGYGLDILASETIAGGSSYPDPDDPVLFEFDGTSAQLTALVDSWFTNHEDDQIAFFLRSPDEDNEDRVLFRSKEYQSGEFAPQLLITYDAAVAAVPEPSTIVLLGLGALVGAVGACRRRHRHRS